MSCPQAACGHVDNREINKLGKNGKSKKCVTTRAPRYVSRADADQVILDNKIKSAINGARGDEGREPENCLSCGGWHIVTRPKRERRAER